MKCNYSFLLSFQLPIANKLVTILQEIDDDILAREVSNKLNIYLTKIGELAKVTQYYEYYLKFVYFDTKNIIKQTKYPLPVKTHVANLITAIYRQRLAQRLPHEN